MKNSNYSRYTTKPIKTSWLNLLILSLGLNFVSCNLAWAKPVTYDFTVNVVQGSLKGNSYSGFFTYDDETITGEAEEKITAEDGLKVCMNFFNQMRDETQDVEYPQFPVLTLQNGMPETLDFWMEPSPRKIWWNRNGWEVEITQRESAQLTTDCNSVTWAK